MLFSKDNIPPLLTTEISPELLISLLLVKITLDSSITINDLWPSNTESEITTFEYSEVALKIFALLSLKIQFKIVVFAS